MSLVDYLRDRLTACTCMPGGAWEIGSVRADMTRWQPGCPVHTAEDVEAQNAKAREVVLNHARVHAKRRPRRRQAQRGTVVWPLAVALVALLAAGLTELVAGLIEWFGP